MSCSIGTAGAVGDELLLMPTRMRFAHVTICALHQCSGRVGHRLVVDTAQQPSRFAAGESRNRLYSRSSARLQPLWPLTSRSDGLHAVAARPPRYGGPAYNRLGSCNAACGRYRRRHQNGSLGRGAGHPSAELSLGSRGVMNRRTLSAMALAVREEMDDDEKQNGENQGKPDNANLPVPVEPSKGDRLHSAAKAALGAVPVAGATLQEVFASTWLPPLEKRRNAWMQSITERMLRLETENRLKFEDLQQDEAFVTLMLNAGAAAVRTHEDEKLNALRNAVLNAACAEQPDRNVELQFVSLVDQLSGWHLRLLLLLADPTRGMDEGHPLRTAVLRSVIPVVEVQVPELRGKPHLIDQLLDDLFNKGLTVVRAAVVAPGYPALGKRTSSLGDAFLQYVLTEPPNSRQNEADGSGPIAAGPELSGPEG